MGRDARERGGRGGEKGRGGGKKKVRTPPPSIPAYAPGGHGNSQRALPEIMICVSVCCLYCLSLPVTLLFW